eukprot:1587697-Alexandrium_andersonii.AAC.1
MSASLVGSEMCIRDRLSAPRPAGPCPNGALSLLLRAGSPPLAVSGGARDGHRLPVVVLVSVRCMVSPTVMRPVPSCSPTPLAPTGAMIGATKHQKRLAGQGFKVKYVKVGRG